MDSGFILIDNFSRFAIFVGLAISVPLFAWAGYLYMSSMGDPNRSAQARSAVISVSIGVIIVGCSFILPVVISQFVVGPSGGIHLDDDPGLNCDGILREQLVVQREASNAVRMTYLISQIQSRHDDCNEVFWSPVIRMSGGFPSDCDGTVIGGVEVPKGLLRGGDISYRSSRDARNNIMVVWTTSPAVGHTGLPSDGALCWMYVSYLDSWVSVYP